MMILDQLWYGNLAPGERKIRPSGEYGKQFRIMEKYEEMVKAELSEAGKKAFEDFMDAGSTASDMSECDSFVTGFRMGVLMMLDVFCPESERGIDPL